MRVIKAHRDELSNYFGYVILPMIHRYQLIDKLVPIHKNYEVDGILLSMAPSDDLNYSKMPLRQIMERNCEARIRSIQVKNQQNHMWITLWEQFATFNQDFYRCINKWIKNLRPVFGNSVKVLKIDLKQDHYGTFSATDYESWNDKFVTALQKSCKKLSELEFGFEDNLDDWHVAYDVDEAYKALKGFKCCQSFVAANIIS